MEKYKYGFCGPIWNPGITTHTYTLQPEVTGVVESQRDQGTIE